MSFLRRLFTDYSMLAVLLVLCVALSIATIAEQHPTGAGAGTSLAGDIVAQASPGDTVLIVIRSLREDREFADALQEALADKERTVIGVVSGGPQDAGEALRKLATARARLAVIAADQNTASWEVLHRDHGLG